MAQKVNAADVFSKFDRYCWAYWRFLRLYYIICFISILRFFGSIPEDRMTLHEWGPRLNCGGCWRSAVLDHRLWPKIDQCGHFHTTPRFHSREDPPLLRLRKYMYRDRPSCWSASCDQPRMPSFLTLLLCSLLLFHAWLEGSRISIMTGEGWLRAVQQLYLSNRRWGTLQWWSARIFGVKDWCFWVFLL